MILAVSTSLTTEDRMPGQQRRATGPLVWMPGMQRGRHPHDATMHRTEMRPNSHGLEGDNGGRRAVRGMRE
ncbi:hypothetical protein BC567DRAFT_228129 [Phyllosticta citribraziliensis]